jgi:hypothetical protein
MPETRIRKYRYNADGSVVCRHRDLSACPSCMTADPMLRDIFGATYRMTDAEYAEIMGD